MGSIGTGKCYICGRVAKVQDGLVKGRIIKGIAGVYTVNTENDELYYCKAKGIFRKDNIKPVIGDYCLFDIVSQKDREGSITDIIDRKNLLIRPSVANIDMALIVIAIKSPDPNFYMLDKLILHFKQQNIPIVLCFNKEDLSEERNTFSDIYKNAGVRIITTSAGKNKGITELKELLKNKTTCILGPSGVGKSTIINALQDNVFMETGDISKKLKRGKHTTRHSEIIPTEHNTYIIDTPGFTSIDVFNISHDELKNYYEDFRPYEECYFSPCSHIHEPDCGVKSAVRDGLISDIRYSNYCHIYDDLKIRSRRC